MVFFATLLFFLICLLGFLIAREAVYDFPLMKWTLLCLFIMGVTIPTAIYLETCWELSQMRAAVDTLPAYEKSIKQTEGTDIQGVTKLAELANKNSEEGQGISVDVDMKGLAYGKEGQASVTSERIKEWRELVERYNRSYRALQMWNDIPVIGIFVKDMPSDMEPFITTE